MNINKQSNTNCKALANTREKSYPDHRLFSKSKTQLCLNRARLPVLKKSTIKDQIMFGQEQEKTKRLTCLKDLASDWLSVWFNKAKPYFPITLHLPRPENIAAIGFAHFIRSHFYVRETSCHIFKPQLWAT